MKPPSASTPPASTLLDLLRDATHGLHRRIDRHPFVRDLGAGVLDQPSYVERLAWFYAFFLPLERALSRHEWPSTRRRDLEIDRRMRAGMLAEDLIAFGVDPASITPFDGLPPIATDAEAIGVLYVHAGSSLGGAAIARRVAHTRPDVAARGLRFFSGHGDQTVALWKALLEVLAEMPTQDHPAAVGAAVATFERLADTLPHAS